VYPQLGGISSSKLSVLSYSTVPEGTFEFEPSLSIFRSQNKFSDNGHLEDLLGENVSSSLSFRITTGVMENMEIGASFASTLDLVMIGTKYAIPFSENEGFAVMAGFSVPAGNKFIADSLQISDDYYTTSLGGSLSFTSLKNIYIDGSLAYTRVLGTSEFDNLVTYGISAGYYLTAEIQPVVELTGYSAFDKDYSCEKLSFNYGITLTVTEKLIVVLGSQIDLMGKNELKGVNYFSAFTIAIN
jgi:hypothetical protein